MLRSGLHLGRGFVRQGLRQYSRDVQMLPQCCSDSRGLGGLGQHWSNTARHRLPHKSRDTVRRRLCQYSSDTNTSLKGTAVVAARPEEEQALYDIDETDMEAMFQYSASAVELEEHWGEAMEVIRRSEQILPPYRPTEEDLLTIRASKPTMTLASLVLESETLQRLVDLGVALHEWDSKGHLGLAVKLDFDRDVAHIVRFLADMGVPHDRIGVVLTKNPLLLEEEEQDLRARISYLRSKNFSDLEIAIMITDAPMWLSYPVKIIDARLGFFQKTFDLEGAAVRQLAVTLPTLITWKGTPIRVKKNIFSLNEEMGFTKDELRQMVMEWPLLLKTHDEKVLRAFETLHNVAGIPHEILVRFPKSITQTQHKLLPRHKYLESLGRAQYCPTLPNYVSPAALSEGDDTEFAEKIAGTSVLLYNLFQKSL